MKLVKSNDSNIRKYQADPYIFYNEGRYYLYCTGGDGVHCYTSDKLSDFVHIGVVCAKEDSCQYWAPCVTKIDEKFYMYYSAMPKTSDDVHTQCLKVAVADKPEGPFVYQNDLAAPFSIDADIALTESGHYMFYSVNDHTLERVGTKIVLDKMTCATELAGKPKNAVIPTLDEEIFCKDRFKIGEHWHTIEGANFFYEDGWYYLLFSGNCYQNNTYYVGYSRAKADTSDLEKIEFLKYPDDNTYSPLLCSDGIELGTGHNSTIKVDGQWYIVYHGRDKSDDLSEECRTARIAKLNVNNGLLSVEKMADYE
ncbi:MAG: glycoside hydrolase family 43 protein [Clostridia bacterium]|nr:glycoside hydrolase family 43 protein [Clostridia bacterium]